MHSSANTHRTWSALRVQARDVCVAGTGEADATLRACGEVYMYISLLLLWCFVALSAPGRVGCCCHRLSRQYATATVEEGV